MILIGNNIKKTKEEFVNDSNIIHNYKYGYEKSIYINALTPLIITCLIHGDFKQTPNKHLIGQGCPYCGKNSKLNTSIFIERSNRIHNYEYDYSLSHFINSKTKIKITCRKHGVFYQLPYNHMNGQGCYKCGVDKIDLNKFVSFSNNVHRNIYDYSLIEEDIKNSKQKVKIICKLHGIFEQRVISHMNGQGCRKCFNITQRINISNKILRGEWNIPNFNPKACQILNNISFDKGTQIQHAMNGGEYHIKELGYWVDGYDKENNIVYEYYEKAVHNKKLDIIRDIKREKEIRDFLKCEFIIIKE